MNWIDPDKPTPKPQRPQPKPTAAPPLPPGFTPGKALYRPDEVEKLLGMGKGMAAEAVKNGELLGHCVNGVGVKPLKITLESLLHYYHQHQVDPNKWKE